MKAAIYLFIIVLKFVMCDIVYILNECSGEAVCGTGDHIVWYTDKLWEYR